MISTFSWEEGYFITKKSIAKEILVTIKLISNILHANALQLCFLNVQIHSSIIQIHSRWVSYIYLDTTTVLVIDRCTYTVV